MKQLSLILVVASSMAFTAGCSSKNYVRNTATPIINKTNELDELTASVQNAQHYIITVEGGADSVGSKDYNYGLSQRRADAVIQYLAQKANIPAHKIFVIGLGKDHPVAANDSSAGRAKNRRVEVRLMTNRE